MSKWCEQSLYLKLNSHLPSKDWLRWSVWTKTTQRLSNFHFIIDCPHKSKGIKVKLAVNNHWVLEKSPGELSRNQTPEPYWHRGLMGLLHFWEMYYNLGLKNAIKQKTTKRCINSSSHKSISNISVFQRKFIKQPIHPLDSWEQQLFGELFRWQSKTTNQTSICTFSKSKKLFPTPNLKKQRFFFKNNSWASSKAKWGSIGNDIETLTYNVGDGTTCHSTLLLNTNR